eukprot:c21659_g2_i1.p1 GENE.c21659_g2_i1~~c21659_g2_i1.p1  ORF type:complete len:392 (+),score=161.28 c21659_g2_i1:22-1176(+)
MGNVQDKVLSKLDTDGDGKITVNDAKKAFFEAFDTDKDGKITFDEAEGTILTVVDKTGSTIDKISKALAPFKDLLSFAFGAFVCFYGKNFTYTIMFLQVFQVSGWPAIKKGHHELKESYLKARGGLKKSFPVLVQSTESNSSLNTRLQNLEKEFETAVKNDDRKSIEKLQQERKNILKDLQQTSSLASPSSLVMLGTCIDSSKIVEIFKGLYAGMVSCMACAMSTSAAKIGVGMNIGSTISTTVNETIRPFVSQQISKITEKNEQLSNESVQRWIDFGVHGFFSAATVLTTYYFEKTMFAVANSLTGAEMMVQALSSMIKSRTKVSLDAHVGLAALQYSFASIGVYHQILRGGGNIPVWLGRTALLFPLLFEKWLSALATTARV